MMRIRDGLLVGMFFILPIPTKIRGRWRVHVLSGKHCFETVIALRAGSKASCRHGVKKKQSK
ncbi:MAG: hypothetical protein J6T57_01160 [Alphaproteobacteria bacterium]|nr:hypothetical protein [Alphaproteobacteria bacterium]